MHVNTLAQTFYLCSVTLFVQTVVSTIAMYHTLSGSYSDNGMQNQPSDVS